MNNILIQDFVFDTVKKFPDNIAICENEKKITYKELWSFSQSISVELRKAGHKIHEVVGVLFPKSIISIASFLGVLISGGTYVPIDLNYCPEKRIINILDLGKIHYVITCKTYWEKILLYAELNNIEFINNINVILIEDISTNTVEYELNTLKADLEITNSDISYILYTSGSTGLPKGVTLTHINALTFIQWAIEYFNPRIGANFSSHAPFHFDLSVFDIYVPLFTGGCLKLVPYEISNAPKKLLEWIKNNEINYWYSVPSVWVAIINYTRIKAGDLNSIEKVLFAGEVFTPKYLRRLMEYIPQASFYNLYGPTETNVCTVYSVKSPEDVADKPVPIGRACRNTEVVALNINNQPIQKGEKGELYVRGSIVTNGYYLDEEKTKSAFIKSPLVYHNNALLYRTGDIVELNDNNEYVYVGRSDFMVKIAGYRVELQEVEYIIQQLDGVEENIVITYDNNERGNICLGAIVKLTENSDLSVIEIRKALLSKLPYYMVPEIIFIVDDIPQNANGKVDRNKAKNIFISYL